VLVAVRYAGQDGTSFHLDLHTGHIIEEIVCQVGHLPELYEDARSKKYKIYDSSILLRIRNFSNL